MYMNNREKDKEKVYCDLHVCLFCSPLLYCICSQIVKYLIFTNLKAVGRRNVTTLLK